MHGIFTIDPECPFLDNLAHGLVDRLGEGLAEAVVLLPSRRACIGLRDAFLRATDKDALLLPRIQPAGEIGANELPLLDADLEMMDVPDAIDPLRRQLLLARLVRAQRESRGGITDEHAIRLAAELAAFLDEMQTEEVPLERLDGLVPDELATHWQEILSFLGLLAGAWPSILADEAALDPPERRRRLLERTIRRWQAAPPTYPVIAAGITGTVPVVGRLLACIAGLEQGCVVLPGLDREMDEASWAAVRTSPAHPQHGLAGLLERLEIDRALVQSWPSQSTSGTVARRRLLAEIMRPAATSEAWQHVTRPSSEALCGLERIEAPGFASEATVLALKIRQSLETQDRTVALVTSDRTLARRVAVELGRFGIDADDTAGRPLDQTPPGSFLLLGARALIEDLAPVPFLALLKHPLASGHGERPAFRRYVRALERGLLRGPRTADGFAGLRRILEQQDEKYWPAPVDPAALGDWLSSIEAAASPLLELARSQEADMAELVQAHLSFAEWLASDEEGRPDELWAKETGEAAARFLAQLQEAARDFPPISVSAYPALLAVLMGSVAVRSLPSRHPRVSILGQLESRLVAADHMLIAGLNEGAWPRAVNPSPWINRSMRAALGLPPAELQIGIAAHDLVMAASAETCVLSRARKDHAGIPTAPSRWMVRLDAVMRAAGAAGAIDATPHWLAWAEALDAPLGPIQPCSRPEPKPPLEARPGEAWVTEIETLIRDPYAFYAQRILDLESLDPLDADPGGAERGQIIHKALEKFVRAHPGPLPEDAAERLLAIGTELFAELEHHPQVRAIWWPRFVEIALWFIEREQKRRDGLSRILVERQGMLDIDTGTGRFTLKARADRVELDKSGQVNLIDYKTGSVPRDSEVRAGVSPQLTLSGLIIEGGGFDQAAGSAGELLYWALRGGHKSSHEQSPARDAEEVRLLIETAKTGIARLIEWYRDPMNGYPAVPRPKIAPTYNDFEHLARIDEWRGAVAHDEADK